MKGLLTIVFIVCITLQCFYSSIYLVEYHLNINSYIENCINKDKVELKCNGKCILAEKLKKRSPSKNQETPTPPPASYMFNYYFIAAGFELSLEHFQEYQSTALPPYIDLLHEVDSSDIFHPPRLT